MSNDKADQRAERHHEALSTSQEMILSMNDGKILKFYLLQLKINH